MFIRRFDLKFLFVELFTKNDCNKCKKLLLFKIDDNRIKQRSFFNFDNR